jgi:hypothetical protein
MVPRSAPNFPGTSITDAPRPLPPASSTPTVYFPDSESRAANARPAVPNGKGG